MPKIRLFPLAEGPLKLTLTARVGDAFRGHTDQTAGLGVSKDAG
jgi:hypothetical protein